MYLTSIIVNALSFENIILETIEGPHSSLSRCFSNVGCGCRMSPCSGRLEA